MIISIITVVYNAVNVIEKTINSILNQGNDVEYVIVDGGSIDGTWEIVQKYKDKISCCIHEKDNGIYDAMNKGVRAASGDVLMFINAGDELVSGSINKIKRIFNEHPEIDILLGRVFYSKSGSRIGISKQIREIPWYGMPCCHQGVAARKNTIEELDYFSLTYAICSDFDWLYKSYQEGYNFYWCNEILATYDIEGVSSTNKYLLLEEATKIALIYCGCDENRTKIFERYDRRKKELQREKENREIINNKEYLQIADTFFDGYSYYIWGAGFEGMECCQLLLDLGKKVESFVDSNQELVNLIPNIMGIKLVSPGNFLTEKNVIIASKNYEKEIEKDLYLLTNCQVKMMEFSLIKKEIKHQLLH